MRKLLLALGKSEMAFHFTDASMGDIPARLGKLPNAIMSLAWRNFSPAAIVRHRNPQLSPLIQPPV